MKLEWKVDVCYENFELIFCDWISVNRKIKTASEIERKLPPRLEIEWRSIIQNISHESKRTLNFEMNHWELVSPTVAESDADRDETTRTAEDEVCLWILSCQYTTNTTSHNTVIVVVIKVEQYSYTQLDLFVFSFNTVFHKQYDASNVLTAASRWESNCPIRH